MAKSQKPPQPPRQRNASRYKRSETSRLVQGALDAGLTVRGIEVDPATGVLCILTDLPMARRATLILIASLRTGRSAVVVKYPICGEPQRPGLVHKAMRPSPKAASTT